MDGPKVKEDDPLRRLLLRAAALSNDPRLTQFLTALANSDEDEKAAATRDAAAAEAARRGPTPPP
jgi:hypothetical protein